MIVLDTCVVIWLAGDASKISKVAGDAIVQARKAGRIAISGLTLYEIAWLANHNRIHLATSIAAFLAETETRFIILPVTGSIAQIAGSLPSSYPSDPMDRLIGATALDSGGALVTPDKVIRKSKAVPVIW